MGESKKKVSTEGSIDNAPGMSDTMCVGNETNNRPQFDSKTKREE